jgi:hypothetical protein
MNSEIVIQVPRKPLPRAVIESDEYKQLSFRARDALLAHVRYVQELPFKLREWLNAGAPAVDLEALANRVDLDIMIHLCAPKAPDDAMSPWLVRTSWVSHSRALAAYLEGRHVDILNQSAPLIGASIGEVETWVRNVSDGLSDLLESFFTAKTFDHAVAYLVAIYVCLAGLKFGIGRVGFQYPA